MVPMYMLIAKIMNLVHECVNFRSPTSLYLYYGLNRFLGPSHFVYIKNIPNNRPTVQFWNIQLCVGIRSH